jgi:zinc protease
MQKIFSLLLMLCFIANISAQSLPQDTVTRKGQLPNGLTYYVRKNVKTPGSANFYIAQKVGSVQEEEDQRGLAHFLEHMCFNGTKHYPGDALLRYLEGIGVKFGQQLNAYTSIDETVYNINNVPTARTSTVDSVLLILHDWSCDLALEESEIDKERGVIHEEWRQGNSAQMRIFNRQLPTLMSNSRPGNRLPIGLMSVIDNFPYQALRDYYHKWYRPDLQAIIVVGDIDVDRTEAKIKEIFSPIAMPQNAAERIYYGVEDNEEAIIVTDHDPELTMTLVSLMFKHKELWPANKKNSIEYLRHKIAKSLVEGMFSSRMQEILLKPETPYLATSFNESDFLLSKVTKCTESYIVPKEGMTYAAITSAIKELCTILDHCFLQSELDRRRSQMLSKLDLKYQNRNKRENAEFIQECLNNYLNGEPMLPIEIEIGIYKHLLPTITLEEVNALYATLFSRNTKNMVMLCINPEKEGYIQPNADSLFLAVKAGFDAKTIPFVDETETGDLIKELPTPGSIVKSKQGHFGGKELILSNGVRVVMLPTTHNDNEILMQAYSPGGTSRYSAEDYITLEAAEELCNISKLGGYKRTDIRKMLAGKQAQVSASLGSRSEQMGGGSSRNDLETMMQLIYLQFQPLEPDMDAAQNLLTQYYTMLKGKENNPMAFFSDSVSTTCYGNNPRNVLLRKEHIEQIDYKRALEIWADRYADASDFTFFFAGTFDEDTLSKYCRQYLATLPTLKRNDKPVNTDLVVRNGNIKNIYKTKMEQPQAMALFMMHAPAKNKKNLKDELVTSILGQAMQMTYTKVIREEMGASYGVGSSADHYDGHDGNWKYQFTVQGNVKPDLYDTCVVVMRKELEKVATNGIPAEYMQRVKEYMQKSYHERQNKNGVWLSYLQTYYRYGIDVHKDYIPTLESITQKDIINVAKTLLKSKNEITVVMLPE